MSSELFAQHRVGPVDSEVPVRDGANQWLKPIGYQVGVRLCLGQQNLGRPQTLEFVLDVGVVGQLFCVEQAAGHFQDSQAVYTFMVRYCGQ